jgi:hypothetical protein
MARGYRRSVRLSSLVISAAAGAALVLGTVGLAGAADGHDGAHATHGFVGENSDLARRITSGSLPKLVGMVNGNRDIEISDRTPKPGRYKIVVRDSTSRHNWHLYGNGKSIATTVRGSGRWVFKLRLTAGAYRVVCDPHADDMEFDLIVG